MQNNIPLITNLRGVAALSVCLYHYVCTVTGFVSNSTIYNIFFYGQKGVQLFFTISSVVISIMLLKTNYSFSFENYWNYIKKRILRIYIPYAVACFLLFFYWKLRSMIFMDDNHYVPTLKTLMSNLLYIVPFVKERWLNNIFWTLSVEIQYYLFIGLVFPFSMKKLFYRILFYLSFYLFFYLRYFYLSTHMFTYWSIYFLMGILYVLWKYKKIDKYEFLLVYVITFILSLFVYGWVDTILSLITLVLIEFFSNYSFFILNYLGKISYSLYLTHVFTGMLLLNLLSDYTSQFFEKFLLLVLSVFIAIAFAHIYYIFIEKPSHHLSKTINHEHHHYRIRENG